VVFARRKKWGNGIEVSGKSDNGFPEGNENIVAERLGGDAFEATVETRGEIGEILKKKIAGIFLDAGGGLDVNERAREFEKIHQDSKFLDERKERKEPRRNGSRLLPLNSASSDGSKHRESGATADPG
jgi:hypothetical protein